MTQKGSDYWDKIGDIKTASRIPHTEKSIKELILSSLEERPKVQREIRNEIHKYILAHQSSESDTVDGKTWVEKVNKVSRGEELNDDKKISRSSIWHNTNELKKMGLVKVITEDSKTDIWDLTEEGHNVIEDGGI